MNPDIREERDKVTFNVEEFTNWYYGGSDNLKKKKFLESFFVDDPELQDEIPTSYLSHKEVYEEAVRKTTIILKKLKQLQPEGRTDMELISHILGRTYPKFIMRQGNPVSVHYDMFIPGLQNLGTTEQQTKWLPRALLCNIIGSYVQTEIGHGTFIRGLETTATYDPKTKEFVVHSPTITAYKFWPGGLGHTANYALVFAQLYTLGKCYGVHAFLVQLRDEATHKPLNGITIGEIGTKVGYNSVNNGFVAFDNVRIPLDQMMMKNSQVLETGEYKKSKSSLLTYGTMTYVRVGIVMDQTALMANACIIATRYSMVRRQSPIEPNEPEPKIIEHVTQQMKIFPIIAKVIVFQKAADLLQNNYVEVMQELEKGHLERLPELHAVSCCLKAICSNEATNAIETCRLACGGHGYLNSAGFSDLYKTATAAQTLEGDSTILLLQTAKFLLKSWNQALKGENLSPSVYYMKNYIKGAERESCDGSLESILKAFESASVGMIAVAFKNIENRKKRYSAEEAINQTGIELVKAAELHCQLFLLQAASSSLNNATNSVSPALGTVLRDILELYAADLAIRSLGNLVQFVNIASADMEALQTRLEESLKKLRNNAIGIVDGFDIPDTILASTLGSNDGNVYVRLLEAAKKSPLNQEDVNQSFHLYLKPYVKSNL